MPLLYSFCILVVTGYLCIWYFDWHNMVPLHRAALTTVLHLSVCCLCLVEGLTHYFMSAVMWPRNAIKSAANKNAKNLKPHNIQFSCIPLHGTGWTSHRHGPNNPATIAWHMAQQSPRIHRMQNSRVAQFCMVLTNWLSLKRNPASSGYNMPLLGSGMTCPVCILYHELCLECARPSCFSQMFYR